LSLSPGLGTPGPAGTRILPLHRFPVSVVYRHGEEALYVVALAAQRRRPGYWVGRG
jgi:toxin ParE1/3/4